MFLEPTNIRSPFTGETAYPKLSTYTRDGKTYQQVCYNDPITGSMIKRGLVSVTDAKTGKLIQDFNTPQANIIPGVSYRS